MIITNPDGLPAPLLKAIVNDPYSKGACDVSCTELVSPPRQAALKRLHADELTESASDRLYALYGQIAHIILERAADASIVEKRLFAPCLGWIVSGQVDYVIEATCNVITDYKMTSVWSAKDGHKPEYVDQLRILRWLCEVNGIVIGGLQNILLFRDWRPSEYKKYAWYPPKVLVQVAPLLSVAEDTTFVEGRVREHQMARAGNLPNCTTEETWEGRRCAQYCAASLFCDQFNPELKPTETYGA